VRVLNHLAIGLLVLAAAAAAGAQQRTVADSIAANSRLVRGAAEPAAISGAQTARALRLAHASIGLRAADARKLAAWGRDFDRIVAEREALGRDTFVRLCGRLTRSEIGVLEIIDALERQDAATDAAIERSFAAAYAKLSARGRNEVDAFASGVVVPGAEVRVTDQRAVAAADPAAFAALLGRNCELKLSLTDEQIRALVEDAANRPAPRAASEAGASEAGADQAGADRAGAGPAVIPQPSQQSGSVEPSGRLRAD